MAEPESESEREARVAVQHVLEISLVREAARDVAWVDYSADGNEHGFEVKAVTAEEFRRLGHQIGTEPYFESGMLSRYWSVLLEVPTMYEKFRPAPDFPADPDDATVARLARDGLIIQRREDRIAEWNAHFDGGETAVPKVRGLARLIEPDLAVLEGVGITCTRGARPRTIEVLHALQRITAATQDAICMSHAPLPEYPPGVELIFSYGYVREGLNALAHRINAWLASPLSNNLLESLSNGSWARRHAVLVFDHSEPEYHTANEFGTDVVPEMPIAMPASVDELWCVLGSTTLRYTREGGWGRYSVI